jgi:hypothetical protein
VSPSTQTAQAVFVNPVIEVEFLAVEANGTPNMVSTTELTLRFSEAIQDLSLDDITMDGGGFTVGGLVPVSGGVYKLPLSNVAAQSTVTVSVIKADYAIGSSLINPVTVSYPLHLTSVTANGKANQQSTDQLTLAFDRAIDGLDASHINVQGATKETLSTTDTPGTYNLGVSGVKKEQTQVTVTVHKDGYAVVSQQVTVVYHRALGTLVEADKNDPSIKKKFGVTTGGMQGVKDTFKELSAFIKNGGLAQNVVKTGDWIDLEGGLKVDAYNSGGGAINIPQDQAASTKAVDAFTNATTPLLRLIVVGVNSFNKVTGTTNNTQHVVFQFLHLPVTRWMHSIKNSGTKYSETEMSSYLDGNFYSGLINAGVPEDVVWAPARTLATSYSTGTEIQKYNVWLPTARELLGADADASVKAGADSCTPETTTNQAKLEYYGSKTSRTKALNVTTTKAVYWTASPATTENFMSITVTGKGIVNDDNIKTSVLGVAPAFCVGPGN